MPGLTKEQKMEMVSKAIDAGFRVEVSFYTVETMEEMNEKLNIFSDLPVEFLASKSRQDAWAKVNRGFQYEDKFEATIFFK